MPMKRSRYPANWEQIAQGIKQAANWTCEDCSRPCRLPGEDDGALIDRITTQHPAWAKDLYDQEEDDEFGLHEVPKLARFTLTTAHPNHDPENPDAVLKAWCSVCHCRYDLREIRRKRTIAAEAIGQLNLLDWQPEPEPEIELPEPPAPVAPVLSQGAIDWIQDSIRYYQKLQIRFFDLAFQDNCNGTAKPAIQAMRRHEISRLQELINDLRLKLGASNG